ncbi:hypothetical protein [Streptomyces sp. NBC_00390]|uniref:hypothetical protein n=1 Tax=Streptomyces sp. NBC_00390 TaxID=2975736 RepID=UPI002E236F1A
MNWTPYYTGTGSVPERPQTLPPPPPWRAPTGKADAADAVPSPSPASTYQADPKLVDAVNAALHLRRPLLLTGPAGSGKCVVAKGVPVR